MPLKMPQNIRIDFRAAKYTRLLQVSFVLHSPAPALPPSSLQPAGLGFCLPRQLLFLALSSDAAEESSCFSAWSPHALWANQSLLKTVTPSQLTVSYDQPRTFSHLSTSDVSGPCLSTSAYPKFNSSAGCPLEASITADPSHCLRALGGHTDKIS